jgi:hypothetical protein
VTLPSPIFVSLESLAKCQGELAEVKRDNDCMAAELVNLRSEMEGVKTAAAISEGSKQDEIADIQRHCREEMASLQRIMTGRYYYGIYLIMGDAF